MTVYLDKRRGVWRYDFRAASIRHVADCGAGVKSRRAAKDVESQARLRVKVTPKMTDPSSVTVNMVARELRAKWDRCRDAVNTQRYVAEISERFGDMPVQEIGASEIMAYIDWALDEPVHRWQGARKGIAAGATKRTPATVNRYLTPLRQILAHATKMRDGATNQPILRDVPEIPHLDVPTRIPRPVPDAVVTRLFQILPRHVQEAMLLTLYFGFRSDEVFGLEIRHIDSAAGGLRLPAEMVKANRDEFLHGGKDAMKFLTRLAKQARQRGVTNLITWRRGAKGTWRPIASPKKAWGTAMAKIEAEFGHRWRWHDLRAAYITHLAMTVKSGRTVQAMARHKDFSTTQRYIAVTEEAVAEAAEQAARNPAITGLKFHTEVPHRSKKPGEKKTKKNTQVIVLKRVSSIRPRSSAG